MRTLLLAGAAIVSLAGLPVGSANAADIYAPAPGYGEAPPAYEPPPQRYAPPPPRGYEPPPAYAPPVYRAPPQRHGYVQPEYAPQPGYAPPPPRPYGPPPVVAYEDDDDFAPPPRRYYRDYAHRPRVDCWWEWGQRRCAPLRGW